MQTAGFDIIVFVIVGIVVAINWVVQRVREQQAARDEDSTTTPSAADKEDWKQPQTLPRPSARPDLPPPLPEFRRREEAQPPRRETMDVPAAPFRPHPVRKAQPLSMPASPSARARVSPRPSTRGPLSDMDDQAAAPMRAAGEAPGGGLHTHVDEWTSEDLPTFRTMEIRTAPPPNTVPDAPQPPQVAVPVAVAGRGGLRPSSSRPSVSAGRVRVPYRIRMTPSSMRQAVVLTEILGRPRGYDL